MLSILLAAAIAQCPVQTAVLRSAADAVQTRYLDAGQAAATAADLRRWAADSRYAADCAAPDVFVRRVNRDLDAFDPHFLLEAPSPAAAGDGDWLTAWRGGSREANAGVREVRVLEGNIGYIRLSSFYPWDLAKPKLESAFALVGDADGLILDLRQNGGGEDTTANHLLVALLAKDATSTVSPQQWIETRQGRREDPLPARALPLIKADVPLAVLTDRRSGSAAEFVAYSLQAAGRAVVIGDRSGGAANMLGEPLPLAHGYRLSVPEARPVNVVTGGNWEGRGVRPDLPGGDDPVFLARIRLRDLLARPSRGN